MSSDTDDNSEVLGYQTPKKKKIDNSKHRLQKYRRDWEKNTKDFGPDVSLWLKPHPNDKGKAKCSCCDLTLSANSTTIKLHYASKRHQKVMKSRDATTSSMMAKFVEKGSSGSGVSLLKKQITEAELKMSAFFATHNLAFKVMDHLVPTLKSCFPDSTICQGMQMKRTKCTQIVTNVIGAAHEEEICEKLKKVKFSILTDESTDMSCKTSCIMVRFYDSTAGRIVSRLYDLHDVFPKGDVAAAEEGATGARLYELMISSLKANDIPLENLLGFGCDSASNNVGDYNSIISRLRQECPGVILMKCVCHSLHRASSDACKTLPRLCEDLARNIFSYFRQSAKRKAQLQQFQEFTSVKDHQMLGLAITRWLSFLPAIERILGQWQALRLYFTDVWLAERTLAAEQIFNALQDPFMKLYYSFLAWVLPKVTYMNAFFQSTTVVVTTLHDKMATAYRELLCTYMYQDYVARTNLTEIQPDDTSRFIRLECIYLGVAVMEGLNNPDVMARPDLITSFRSKCRDYLIHLCKGIKDRFPFDDKLLMALPVLQPEKALSARQRDRTPSLLFLCELCPRAKPSYHNELQQLDDEWRRLSLDQVSPDVAQEKEVDVFWHKISQIAIDGEKTYTVLPQFALAVLTLPHSNADTERLFSKNNLTKTRIRNKLATKTVKGALLSAQCVKNQSKECCYGFKPTEKMISRMTSAVLYSKTAGAAAEVEVNSDSDDPTLL
ncbi:uncharacterized protein LOC113497004 [Trichoplusia ni]|uniref:Uncharacterized protein LOC113497004 n=1 Tax=Trichoplusia ni TaxID=7111 RepID=A0A7E5VV67_TRINI|nr:uncharacterized protein LOC113497004 [Trichoplusia ni]